MKRLLTLAILCSALACGRAEILIYKIAGTTRAIGGGLDSRKATTGYLVWNPTTGELQSLFASIPDKVFCSQAMSVTWFKMNGPAGKTATAFRWYSESNSALTNAVAYGYDALLQSSQEATSTAPRSFTLRPQMVLFTNYPEATSLDLAVRCSFSQKDTQQANTANYDVNAATASLKLRYSSAGYVEQLQ